MRYFETQKPNGIFRRAWFAISLLFGAEIILAYCAEGAYEIFGNIFPLGAGSDTAIGIAFSLVIDPATYIAYVLHCQFLLFLFLF